MKPTAILTADWHLREDTPKCRTDDFWQAQWAKVKFIKELYEEYKCSILHSGDLFHHWKPSPRLISWCIEKLPFMYVIPGNHDLPNHNLELLEKSGLYTLEKARKINIMRVKLWNHYHMEPIIGKTTKVAIIHKLINHPQSNTTAKELMKKHKHYELILSGDNHETFVEKNKRQTLVNPGSLMRQTAAQEDHKPCIFLWYAEEKIVKKCLIPIKKGVVSREHLNKIEKRDERMETFITRLNTNYDIELNFQDNIKSYFNKNRTHTAVKKLVWESLEGEL